MWFRFKKKFIYAGRGLGYVFKRESSFKQELFIAGGAIIVGWYLSFSKAEWLILILTIAVVLSAEVFNTILERLLDLIEPRLSIHIALLKDLLAAAVLLLCLAALVIGLLLIWSHIS
jgi:diacylglycerol kinase